MRRRPSAQQCLSIAVSVVLSLGAWLFFWLLRPEWMSFQEQNQLFLWTGDYLWQRLTVAGGLADWMGEFLVQFFRVEWLGAALMGVLFVLMQQAGRKALALTPRSSFLTHHSSLITHHSSLITHHSSFITHHSSLITSHFSCLSSSPSFSSGS